LDLLEDQLKTAESNICLAASAGPMYGTLFCIRKLLHVCDFRYVSDYSEDKLLLRQSSFLIYMFLYRKLSDVSAWNNLISNLIELSFKVNAAVVGIVNSSSPEGHLPMDFGKGMCTIIGLQAFNNQRIY